MSKDRSVGVCGCFAPGDLWTRYTLPVLWKHAIAVTLLCLLSCPAMSGEPAKQLAWRFDAFDGTRYLLEVQISDAEKSEAIEIVNEVPSTSRGNAAGLPIIISTISTSTGAKAYSLRAGEKVRVSWLLDPLLPSIVVHSIENQSRFGPSVQPQKRQLVAALLRDCFPVLKIGRAHV